MIPTETQKLRQRLGEIRSRIRLCLEAAKGIQEPDKRKEKAYRGIYREIKQELATRD